MAVNLLVCELAMAGRSEELSGAWQSSGRYKGWKTEQVTVTQNHKRNLQQV